MRSSPDFALELTRNIGGQLAGSRSSAPDPAPPDVIAVVGIHDAAWAPEIADTLERELARYARWRGSITTRTGRCGTSRSRSTGPSTATTACCWSAPPPRLASPGPTSACARPTARSPSPTARRRSAGWSTASAQGLRAAGHGGRADPGVIEALAPREVQVVPAGGLDRALEATARRLAGLSIGLVLSGGGARVRAPRRARRAARGGHPDRPLRRREHGLDRRGDRRDGRLDRGAPRDLRPLLRAPEPEPRLHAAGLRADPRRAHAQAARRRLRRPPDRGAPAPLLLRRLRPVRARARRPPHRPDRRGGLHEPRHPGRLPAGQGRRPAARRRRRDGQPAGRDDGGGGRGPGHRGRRLAPRPRWPRRGGRGSSRSSARCAAC